MTRMASVYQQRGAHVSDVVLRAMLIMHEGKRYSAYQDSLGYWTIGVGRLIDARKGGRLSDDEIELMLTNDIKNHKALLLQYQPWVANLDEVRQAVMFDMTFNLGIEPFDNDGIKDWPNFINQVRTGQYTNAAANMRSTTWAKQVGSRATRLAQMMETGEWPKELSGVR